MPGSRQLASYRFWLIGTWVRRMSLGCAGQRTGSDLTEAEIREDLACLAGVFAQREQSFTPQSRVAFGSRLAAVQSDVASMSHDAFIAGIQWSVAAAENGHTETRSNKLYFPMKEYVHCACLKAPRVFPP